MQGVFSSWSIPKGARVWKGLQSASQDHWPDTRKISSFDQRTELQAFLIRCCPTTTAKGRESLGNPADIQHSPSEFLCAECRAANHKSPWRREKFNSSRDPYLHSHSPHDMLELCLKGVTHIFPTSKSDQPQWYCKVSNRTQVLGSMSGRKVAIISCSPLNPGNELSSPPTTSTGPNIHCHQYIPYNLYIIQCHPALSAHLMCVEFCQPSQHTLPCLPSSVSGHHQWKANIAFRSNNFYSLSRFPHLI